MRRLVRLPEEIVADSFAPTWRDMLVRKLSDRGLSQNEVASLLGISQSAVSKHLVGRLTGDARLAHEPRMLEAAERVAAGLAAKTMSPVQAMAEAAGLVRAFEDRGPICRIHEEEMPALQGLGCDLCVRLGAAGAGAQLTAEQAALQDLRSALRILENVPQLASLLPYVGANLARALPGANDITQVAAVPGRLFVLRGAVKVPAAPEFGVSRHTAEVLLAVGRADAKLLACLNLAPDPALLAAARAEGLRVEKVDATFERAPQALAFPPRDEGDAVPDVFYHEGAFGVEPQAYFVAHDATALAMRVRALLASLRRSRVGGAD